MSIDWNYVLKRVFAGLALFLAIYVFKNYILLNVHAETLSASNVCVIEGTNSTCNPPPVYRPFNTTANNVGFNVWFQQSNLTSSNTSYNYEFRTTIVGLNIDDPMSSLSMFVGNGGTASNLATADRNQVSSFYNSSTNEYTFIYSFGMDTINAFDTIRFSWANSMSVAFNGQPVGIKSASLSLTTSSGGSGNQTNQDIINNNNNNTQNIINNNNQNTQNIIDNNNTNTQDIIDNQNENTQKEIESQQVCDTIDFNDTIIGGYLGNQGQLSGTPTSTSTRVTDFYRLNNSSTIKVLYNENTSSVRTCFYKKDKSNISCYLADTMSVNTFLTIPDDSVYVRFTIVNSGNFPRFKLCSNGNQALQDSLTDDSIDSNTGEDFFNNFNYGDDSLAAVITAPLRFINKITDTCQPLSISLFSQTITIPCGDTVFWNKSNVSTFRVWWNMFFGGIMIYTLGLKAYKVVHDAIDPEKDDIETVGVV